MSQETQFSQFIAMKNEGSYKVKRQYQSKEKASQLSQIYTDAKKYSKSIKVKLIVHQTDRIADSSIIVSNPELRLPDIRPKFTTLQTDASSPLGGLNYFRLNIIEKQPPILTKLEKITYRQQLLKMLPQRKTQRSAIDASDTLLNSYVQRIKQVSQIKPEKEYTLEHHINVINTALVQDKQLKFTSKHYFIHKHFITQLLTSDEQSFELQKLHQIHKCLNITKEQFTRFKIHIISHILQMGMEKEKVLKICERFEFYRPFIVSEEIHLKVLGGLNGLQVISSNLYDRLYKDPILNSHFKNADQSTLSKKFAKAFYHVLSMNENLHSLNQLKHRHQNLDINYQQFAQFKLQLSRTLQQQGVKFKFIREALSRMDVFKQSIINKQSASDLVQQNNLVEKFTKACLNEPILFDISHFMGKQKFSNHCEFVMLYFSGMNIKAFTHEDLMAIHCHKKIVNERTFECFKSRAYGEVSRCTFDRILLEDYKENWDQAKPFILGKNYSGVIHKLGGQKFISHLSQLVEYEFIIREISHHFNSDEFSVNENIRCKLNLLLYANRFYKKTDLEVIHSQLKINNELYDSFKNAIMTALNTYEELKWIEHVIEDYRSIIVT